MRNRETDDLRTARRLPRGLVFTFTLATGMRPGEVLALRWEDLDLSRRGPRLFAATSCSSVGGRSTGSLRPGATRRVVPRPSSMIQLLRTHRRRQAELRMRLGTLYQDEDLVFADLTGGPLSPANLTNRDFKLILRRAGLPPELRWYDLRHTCATLLLAAGENVKVVAERLGHAKTALTLDL